MPLPDSQFGGMMIPGGWGMMIPGLLNPLLQLSFHGWFGHWVHCYCPGHQGFLSEDLWVSHTLPYHHDCLFASFPQLCVCDLYSEALWQRAIFSLQGLYHDVNMFSSVDPSCFHWQHMGGKGLYSLYVLGEHYLVIII